jgi:hypothetical protein
LESEAKERVYTAAYEQKGIVRRKPDGIDGTIVHDPRALLSDTMSAA